MTRPLLLLSACAALAAGCHARMNPLGTAPPYSFRTDPKFDPEHAVETDTQAWKLEIELGKLSSESARPDCGKACGLVAEICAIGEKLCAIAARHEGDAYYGEICEGATQRCQRSREKAAACACPR